MIFAEETMQYLHLLLSITALVRNTFRLRKTIIFRSYFLFMLLLSCSQIKLIQQSHSFFYFH